MDEYWRGVTAGRRGGQRAMVARIAELGELRLDLDRATDLIVVLVGHDVFRGLVQDAGWSATACRVWLFTTLIQQLLGTSEVDPDAVSGLSFVESLAR